MGGKRNSGTNPNNPNPTNDGGSTDAGAPVVRDPVRVSCDYAHHTVINDVPFRLDPILKKLVSDPMPREQALGFANVPGYTILDDDPNFPGEAPGTQPGAQGNGTQGEQQPDPNAPKKDEVVTQQNPSGKPAP